MFMNIHLVTFSSFSNIMITFMYNHTLNKMRHCELIHEVHYKVKTHLHHQVLPFIGDKLYFSVPYFLNTIIYSSLHIVPNLIIHYKYLYCCHTTKAKLSQFMPWLQHLGCIMWYVYSYYMTMWYCCSNMWYAFLKGVFITIIHNIVPSSKTSLASL